VVIPLWLDRPPLEAIEVGLLADRHGYQEIWVGEMLHFDAFALASALAVRTRFATLTLGPLAVGLRDPVGIAMGVGSVSVLGRRPSRLALGGSSPTVVARWHGRAFGSERGKMTEAITLIRAVLAGQRTDHRGSQFRSNGFRSALGAQPAHITVAALGPRMMGIAASQADRVVMNLVTASQVEEAARTVSIPLAVWVVAGVDPSQEALHQVRRQLSLYLAAPGYREMLTRAGLGERVAEARAGRPLPDLAAAMTIEDLSRVMALGSPRDVRDSLSVYERTGAQVMVVPVTAGDAGGARTLGALAV
jgi:probable F420-dependent oxidoreductase